MATTIIRLYEREDGEMVDVCNVTRDHFYGSWDDEEGSENVIIDASINIKVNHVEGNSHTKRTFDEISSIKFYENVFNFNGFQNMI